MAWSVPLPTDATVGSTKHIADHNALRDAVSEVRSKVDGPDDKTIAATEHIAHYVIDDDASLTDAWPDRFRVTFAPEGGTDVPTFWLNEYGELRGSPAKVNTVGHRIFAALNAAGYTARSGTIPIMEVTDQRDGTRTTIFGVYKGGRVTMNRIEANETRTTANTTPWIVENMNYTVTTADADHMRIFIQGVMKFWMNEWGAIRGTSPYTWGDALVRAIRDNGDGITSGNALEVVDRRTGAPTAPANVMWGVGWVNGQVKQSGHVSGGVLTLEAGQTAANIAPTYPAGGLVVRKLA